MILKRKKKVKTDEIRITPKYAQTPPKSNKLIRKTAAYIKYGTLDTIYLDKNLNLIDGYCSYLIAKALGVEKIKCVIVREQT